MKIVTLTLLLLLISCSLKRKHDSFSQVSSEDYLQYHTPTFDRATLEIRLFLPDPEKDLKTAVIIAGDNHQTIEDHGSTAKHYQYLGYTSILFSYRSESENSPLDNSQYYYTNTPTIDLMTAVAWVKQNVQYDRLGLHCFQNASMAGALALAKINLSFAIFESPIINPWNEIQKKKAKMEADTICAKICDQFPQVFLNLQTPTYFVFNQTEYDELDQNVENHFLRKMDKTLFPKKRTWNYWDSLPKVIARF